MYDSKAWYASKTVWGGLIALLAGVAGMAGIALTAEDQLVLTDSITAVASAIGGVLAIVGRVKASKAIGKE